MADGPSCWDAGSGKRHGDQGKLEGQIGRGKPSGGFHCWDRHRRRGGRHALGPRLHHRPCNVDGVPGSMGSLGYGRHACVAAQAPAAAAVSAISKRSPDVTTIDQTALFGARVQSSPSRHLWELVGRTAPPGGEKWFGYASNAYQRTTIENRSGTGTACGSGIRWFGQPHLCQPGGRVPFCFRV